MSHASRSVLLSNSQLVLSTIIAAGCSTFATHDPLPSFMLLDPLELSEGVETARGARGKCGPGS